MSNKTVDVGGQLMLNVLFGATAKPAGLTIQLFTDGTPTLADSDINTTHELATGGGYVDKTITSQSGTVTLNGSNIPLCTWGIQTWTFTGALTNATNKTIKGYQVLSGTTLLFEDLLRDGADAAITFTPANNGDVLNITPKYLLGNGTPA
jgi:hypothetical protein